MKRSSFIKVAAVSSLAPFVGFGVGVKEDFNPAPLIKAPDNPKEWEAFLDKLEKWRKKKKAELNYDDRLYDLPDFRWVRSNFNCYFLMMCDLKFYDPEQSVYLVDEFISETEQQFGKISSLVLWHAYPRIGVDQRNQFDFYRDMPGGLEGVKKITEKLHKRDVKVFINYNPWDTATRREPKNDVDTLVEIIDAIKADGIFLDTMNNLEEPIRSKLDSVGKGIVLESELDLPVKDIASHHCSWAQWFEDSKVPGILRNKWFEPRHMQHQIKRWDHDHSGELHTAWMNGSGMMIWENVFGTWMGWNERDKSMLRSMSLIQQFFSKMLTSEGTWQPLVKTLHPGIYANKWENEDYILFALVNRGEKAATGNLLELENKRNYLYFHSITGEQIKPEIRDKNVLLPGQVGKRYIAGFIISKTEPDQSFLNLLEELKATHTKRSLSEANPVLKTVQIKPKSENSALRNEIPNEMVLVPGADKNMEVSFRVRECTQQLPFGSQSRFNNFHNTRTANVNEQIGQFAIDKYPVTNGDFKEFLKKSKYQPEYQQNFLKHWEEGKIPNGMEDHPVVNISLEDARAFASWRGKRLPTIHEWTLAAVGDTSSKYPWGDELKEDYCNLNFDSTTSVDNFPNGVSPFGCFDMIGNTWEWTESEYSDGRTRFCFLKGGSYYQPTSSKWYVLGGPKPANWIEKFLLMWPGLDRCSTVGFRCVVDI